jgi:hypothetical protein
MKTIVHKGCGPYRIGDTIQSKSIPTLAPVTIRGFLPCRQDFNDCSLCLTDRREILLEQGYCTCSSQEGKPRYHIIRRKIE